MFIEPMSLSRILARASLPLLWVLLQLTSCPSSPGQTAVAPPRVLRFLAVTADGSPVADLKPEDLELRVGKQPRKIVNLVSSAAEHRNIGFLFDISGSRRSDMLIPDETQAALQFLRSIWRADDSALVLAFGEITVNLAPPTSDLTQIEAALAKIPAAQYRGSTALYDALCSIHTSATESSEGETLLIVFGDFEDNTSRISKDAAIDKLRKNNIRVFPLLRPTQERFPRVGKLAEDAAKKFARSTGGDMFKVENERDLAGAFHRLDAELKGAYRLTYDFSPGDSQHTKVELRTSRPNISVLFAR